MGFMDDIRLLFIDCKLNTNDEQKRPELYQNVCKFNKFKLCINSIQFLLFPFVTFVESFTEIF